MLYDKRWDKTKADPFSLTSLISWLEMQPADEAYDFDDCKGACLYGQYGAAHGISWPESGAACSQDAMPGAEEFCALVYRRIASPHPWTFGAALTRAKAALKVQS